MIAEAIKDVNWFDFCFPPLLKTIVMGVIASAVAVFLIVKIISWFGVSEEKGNFILDAIEAIKALFGK